MLSRVFCGSLVLWLAACASTAPVAPVADAPPPKPYLEQALVGDKIIVGAQPAATDFAALKEAGVDKVINLRPASEMSAIPGFDEPALASQHALNYLSIPIGGTEHPYTPEALERFAQAVAASEGKVLLHCASGGRAGQLYAAYLVKYEGRTPEEALRSIESLGAWPLPMERLLNRPLKLEFK